MRLVYVRETWALESAFGDQWLPKAARWAWHGKSCPAPAAHCVGCNNNVPRRMWYTVDDQHVVNLVLLYRLVAQRPEALEGPGDNNAVRRLEAALAARLGGFDLAQAPAVTPTQRGCAQAAMKLLAARTSGEPGSGPGGFSRFDAPIGVYLGTATLTYNDRTAWYATQLARRYHRQLSDMVLQVLGVSPEPEAAAEHDAGGRLPYKD
jgi:hypothetical protein